LFFFRGLGLRFLFFFKGFLFINYLFRVILCFSNCFCKKIKDSFNFIVLSIAKNVGIVGYTCFNFILNNSIILFLKSDFVYEDHFYE
jgi:hypothetical protein